MEQESECLKKMKNGDLEARNELIERNMRLVAHVAKKYQSPEDEMVKQTPGWVIMAYVIDALLAAAFVGVEIILIRKYMRDKDIAIVSVDDASKEGKQE